MRYILKDDIALRSWRLVPYAYYRYGIRDAKGLTAEEFTLLSRCDGQTELEDSTLLHSLAERGLLEPCPDKRSLTDWQRPRVCDNRYFPALNWAITGKCNFNCRHCFMAADNAPLMSEFSWEECVALLDECVTCGIQTVTLTGGEPMLHPRFLDIAKACAERHINIGEINTNGSFITPELLDSLHGLGLNPCIKISFDGLGHHDWLRGAEGTEEQTLNAIRITRQAGFRVRAQMNVHRGNLDTLMPTALLLDELGVEGTRVIRTTEAPRWLENGKGLCLDILEYYDRMLDFTRDYLASGRGMEIDIWQFLNFYPRSRCYHNRTVEYGVHRYRDSSPVCRGNRGIVAVASTGAVSPCNQLSGTLAHNGVDMGNVKRDGLQPLLQAGPYLNHVTTTVGALRAQNPDCQECPWWKLCMGGCRACAYALGGDLMGSDPTKCLFFKQGYLDKIAAVFDAVGGYTCMDDLNE